MWRFAQVGIALGALGAMICLMGLFPSVTGAEPTVGIGLVQVAMILFGYSLLILGALTYVKYTFYLDVPATLSQQIGTRLALTGLLFAALAGLADILGFGTHIRDGANDIFFGRAAIDWNLDQLRSVVLGRPGLCAGGRESSAPRPGRKRSATVSPVLTIPMR